MKPYKYCICAIVLMITAISCQKNGLINYQGNNDVYFSKNYSTSTDTGIVTFAFSLATLKDSIISIPVSVMGNVEKIDRPCSVVIADSSTAKVGTHYDALPDTFKIHAGKTVDSIKLKVYRTTDLQTNSVSIILMLKNNNYFSTDMQTRTTNSLTGAYFSYVKYRIVLSDILTQPKYWYAGYMGNFSRKKLYLLSNVIGVPVNDIVALINGTASNLATQNYWGRTMQIWLNQQKANGTPVYEDDGVTLMIMGTLVQ